MRKITYILASIATVFAISCSKEKEEPVVVNPESGLKTITISASVSPDTKVSSDNTGKYTWQVGDKISVVTSSEYVREFATSTSGTAVDFSGLVKDGDGLGKYAMYPASENHAVDGNHILFNLDNEFEWSGDAARMPMIGKITGTTASFKAVGGVLKLVLYNIPAEADYFNFSATNKKISGDFEISDASAADVTIDTASKDDNGNNSITIDFSANYSANKVFYIPLPTGTIDGFTVELWDDQLNTLFSKTTTASLSVTANKLIIGPALNCSAPASDDVLSNATILAAVNGAYPGETTSNTVSITSSREKIWKANACKQSSKMQLRNNKGSHIQLPNYDDNISSIILEGVYNTSDNAYSGTITFSTAASSGTTITSVTPSVSAGDDVTISVPSGITTGYILTSAGLRITSITVKFSGASFSAPTITPADDALVIAVASGDENSASTTFTYTNAIDALGVQVTSDKEWARPVISGTGPYTLTVSADKKTDAGAREQAKVTLRASGVSKVITVDQPSALVDNPASLTIVPRNEAFDATWAPVDNATGYKAYLHTSSTATPATDGTELTPVLEGGVYMVSASGLTNGDEYHLYVKTNAVAANYIAPTEFVHETITPTMPAKGTIGNPYTVSEAWDAIDALADNGESATTVYVSGEIQNVAYYSSNTITYWISNDGSDAVKKVQVYKGTGIGGADFSVAGDLEAGYAVVVGGKLKKYKSGINYTYEIINSSQSTCTKKVAAPTMSLAEGTYYIAQNVEIETTTDGASIYYTTDGSEPTALAGTLYSAPVSISSTTTLKAIAVKDSYADSHVLSVTYTFAAPTQLEMSDITCTAQTENSLTFEWTTVANATGYQVSIDNGENWGSTQTDLSYVWSGLSASTTYTIKVKAIGTTNGQYSNSNAKSANGTTSTPAAVSAPLFSRASGSTVASNLKVTISSPTEGSTIYYTTNGDTPTVGGATTTAGTAGTASAEITIAKTIKAIAVKGDDVSAVSIATYTLRHTDTITANMLEATNTSYSDFSGVSATSKATYAGNNSKDNSGNIQMRSKNSNSGIVSTASGGTLVSVTINVGSGSNTVDVYGKTTAYSAASELYNNSSKGTKLGSTSSTGTISGWEGSYQYVGIRSNSGAIYLSSVVIVWDE